MEPAWYPVFPLRCVCFPGHRMALRIFEERYQRLLEDAADRPEFVIALISHGKEVGGSATPYRVGTLMRFDSIEPQGDFQTIQPIGLRRLYLENLDRTRRPYLSAQCVGYADETSEAVPEAAELEARILDAVAETKGELVERMRAALTAARENLDAENFSLFLCGCLSLPPIYAQRLLEARSAPRRIADALRMTRGGAA